MPTFCDKPGCPGDKVTCQKCGRVACSVCDTKFYWRPDVTGSQYAGNVCEACLLRHAARAPETKDKEYNKAGRAQLRNATDQYLHKMRVLYSEYGSAIEMWGDEYFNPAELQRFYALAHAMKVPYKENVTRVHGDQVVTTTRARGQQPRVVRNPRLTR